jgi:hypothetical protein
LPPLAVGTFKHNFIPLAAEVNVTLVTEADCATLLILLNDFVRMEAPLAQSLPDATYLISMPEFKPTPVIENVTLSPFAIRVLPPKLLTDGTAVVTVVLGIFTYHDPSYAKHAVVAVFAFSLIENVNVDDVAPVTVCPVPPVATEPQLPPVTRAILDVPDCQFVPVNEILVATALPTVVGDTVVLKDHATLLDTAFVAKFKTVKTVPPLDDVFCPPGAV